ncbi:ABC transporter permease [Streptomyces sp. NPDC088400]|uniref:ABC transporter permease n=1 Tax=Streptomyces sp. NPDC088400 TaxID=3365861 RepID=UPI00381F3375
MAAARDPDFLQTANLTEILRSSVTYFVPAAGATLLIIGGGLDFSAGAVFTLGAIAACELMVHGVPVPIAVVAAGAVLGTVNFALITYWNVPPIIATLGMFFVVSGVDTQITCGNDVLPLPESFTSLATAHCWGSPT